MSSSTSWWCTSHSTGKSEINGRDIIQNESEEKREQDEYWEEKALMDKQLIE